MYIYLFNRQLDMILRVSEHGPCTPPNGKKFMGKI